MIAAIKRLFATPEIVPTEDQLRLAGAMLLLEVGYADFSLGDAEQNIMLAQLRRRFSLSADELDDLVSHAMERHKQTVSLHEQVALINEHYDAAAKRRLIHDLWGIAYADGDLHHYEEAVIRRLADLLYVPHRDFIKTKHDVSGQL